MARWILAILMIGCASARHDDPRDLRIRVDWLEERGMVSAEMYGGGAGVWNDQMAFRMSPQDVRAVAAAVHDARFASMPGQVGETESDFLSMRGKVTVDGKTVVQLLQGDQSEPLATLAAVVLTRAENAARNGVGASSLPDALRKIGNGEIPPEALRITTQQRGDSGFVLNIRAGQAVARSFEKSKGFGPPRSLSLSKDDLRRLATLLGDLPTQNVSAPVYTELRVEVLNQSKDLLARPEFAFAPNANFNRVVEELRKIAER